MQVLFYEKDMKKNIEFTKSIYSMTDLEGYNTFFDKFSENVWKRDSDSKMDIEKFVIRMENSNFFVGKLFLGEDYHIPIRYSVNACVSVNEDSLLEVHCDLSGKNYTRLYSIYKEIYGIDFHDSI